MSFGDVCLNCKKRNQWCHTYCKEYFDEKAAHDARNAAIRAQKERERDAIELKARAQEKAMKRYNTKR